MTLLSTEGAALSSGYVTLDVILERGALGHRAGGTAANVAADLAFLGWSTSVSALIGDDPAGDHLVGDLKRAGVETSPILRDSAATTPVVIHEILDSSHRFRFGCPTCGRKFSRFRPVPAERARSVAVAAQPDVFFFDRVSLSTLSMAEVVRESGGLVMFEPSTRGRADLFSRALDVAHVVKVSHERLVGLADRLRAEPQPGQLQIVTHGGDGVTWRRGRSAMQSVSGYKMSIVDTGGAGDWATAAWLASLPSLKPSVLSEIDFTASLRVAQAVAAISCTAVGARGLSHVMDRRELIAAAQDTMARRKPAHPRTNRLRQSRRDAGCRHCLAAA